MHAAEGAFPITQVRDEEVDAVRLKGLLRLAKNHTSSSLRSITMINLPFRGIYIGIPLLGFLVTIFLNPQVSNCSAPFTKPISSQFVWIEMSEKIDE